ncbi:MAG TPA: hypothetical protein VN253_07815 [Kofleriaceae bacterium]|nr:hypothetical protein [Kofleriaceae bacterium]
MSSLARARGGAGERGQRVAFVLEDRLRARPLLGAQRADRRAEGGVGVRGQLGVRPARVLAALHPLVVGGIGAAAAAAGSAVAAAAARTASSLPAHAAGAHAAGAHATGAMPPLPPPMRPMPLRPRGASRDCAESSGFARSIWSSSALSGLFFVARSLSGRSDCFRAARRRSSRKSSGLLQCQFAAKGHAARNQV